MNPIVTLHIKDADPIEIELFPDIAPNTVRNFIALVQSGFYNGLLFHRVIPGFMIQGGCPQGDGTGGPGYSIRGEFSANGFENDLKHTRGVISMARTRLPNSAGSQFFIMAADSPHLDGQYAAFGQVVKGMEQVDRIISVATHNDCPNVPQVISEATIDTFGELYPEAVKM